MVDNIRTMAVDSSPLIYLAKLRALDVFKNAQLVSVIPPAVVAETATPALVYQHADAAAIDEAIQTGAITVVQLALPEREIADQLVKQHAGLGRGEAEVLALALERRLPTVVADRRGRTVARQLQVQLRDIVDVLFEGTPGNGLLRTRIRELATLVNMRVADYEQLLLRVDQRRLR